MMMLVCSILVMNNVKVIAHILNSIDTCTHILSECELSKFIPTSSNFNELSNA